MQAYPLIATELPTIDWKLYFHGQGKRFRMVCYRLEFIPTDSFFELIEREVKDASMCSIGLLTFERNSEPEDNIDEEAYALIVVLHSENIESAKIHGAIEKLEFEVLSAHRCAMLGKCIYNQSARDK